MKGIMFKSEMFQAVIDERKTQTRRLGGLEEVNKNPDRVAFTGMRNNPVSAWQFDDGVTIQFKQLEGIHASFIYDNQQIFIKPRYQPGETVYLKEPYIDSKADGLIYRYRSSLEGSEYNHFPWKNKMFMPARHARYFIEIITARPERLQNISEYDAHWEGIEYYFFPDDKNEPSYYFYPCNDIRDDSYLNSPITSFYSLWKSIKGQKSWNKNPWVWVYQFNLKKEVNYET